MEPISTFIFIDLETTGFPWAEHNKTKIIEMALVAVKRQHLLYSQNGAVPRVLSKLSLCFNPQRLIQEGASRVTGLSNELLELEKPFDASAFALLSEFLNRQSKPMCFVAHNGDRFDYKILRTVIRNINEKLPDDLTTIDSLPLFKAILSTKPDESITEVDNLIVDMAEIQRINETTPKREKQQIKRASLAPKARRRLPFTDGDEKLSWKLTDIYQRVLGKPAFDAHRAENDCLFIVECAVATAHKFIDWADSNRKPFNNDDFMEIGTRFNNNA